MMPRVASCSGEELMAAASLLGNRAHGQRETAHAGSRASTFHSARTSWCRLAPRGCAAAARTSRGRAAAGGTSYCLQIGREVKITSSLAAATVVVLLAVVSRIHRGLLARFVLRLRLMLGFLPRDDLLARQARRRMREFRRVLFFKRGALLGLIGRERSLFLQVSRVHLGNRLDMDRLDWPRGVR